MTEAMVKSATFKTWRGIWKILWKDTLQNGCHWSSNCQIVLYLGMYWDPCVVRNAVGFIASSTPSSLFAVLVKKDTESIVWTFLLCILWIKDIRFLFFIFYFWEVWKVPSKSVGVCLFVFLFCCAALSLSWVSTTVYTTYMKFLRWFAYYIIGYMIVKNLLFAR